MATDYSIDDLPRLSDEEATHTAAVDLERAEPAIYTHGLSPLELLGQLRRELLLVRSGVVCADSLVTVAALALRNMDCDHDGDVADVLQNHVWTELKGARDALETAEQILNRLDQLSENAALGAALREVFHG